MRQSSLVAVLVLVAGLVWAVPAGAHHAGLPHATDDPSADPRSFVMPGGFSSVTPPGARLRAQAVRRSSRRRAAGAAPRGLSLNLTGALKLEPSSADAHADVAALPLARLRRQVARSGLPRHGRGHRLDRATRRAREVWPTRSTTRGPPWRTCRPCGSRARRARHRAAGLPASRAAAGWPGSSSTTSPTRPHPACSATCPGRRRRPRVRPHATADGRTLALLAVPNLESALPTACFRGGRATCSWSTSRSHPPDPRVGIGPPRLRALRARLLRGGPPGRRRALLPAQRARERRGHAGVPLLLGRGRDHPRHHRPRRAPRPRPHGRSNRTRRATPTPSTRRVAATCSSRPTRTTRPTRRPSRAARSRAPGARPRRASAPGILARPGARSPARW